MQGRLRGTDRPTDDEFAAAGRKNPTVNNTVGTWKARCVLRARVCCSRCGRCAGWMRRYQLGRDGATETVSRGELDSEKRKAALRKSKCKYMRARVVRAGGKAGWCVVNLGKGPRGCNFQ